MIIERLVNMSQNYFSNIYFFARLHDITEVDATYLLLPDPVVATLCHQLLTTRSLP